MNTNDPKSSKEPNQPSDEMKEERIREKIRKISEGRKVDEIYDYAKQNKGQAVTYILIVLGLLILLFNGFIGGLIIGMVVGYYFSSEIIYFIRNISQLFSGPYHLRYVALGGLGLALLIAAPGIFIGAAIVAAFKELLIEKKNDSFTE